MEIASLPKAALLSPLALGLTSMVSQILLLREIVVACYGNELSLGIMLSVWLLWVGLGSYLGGIWARRRLRPERHIPYLYPLLGLLLLVSLLLVRSSRSWGGIGPGEVMPLPAIVLYSFLLSLPLCFLLGLLFVFNARLFGEPGSKPGEGVSLVYLWEAIGAFLGGILSTYLLIPYLSNLEISLLVLALNLFVPFAFMRLRRPRLFLTGGLLLLGLLIALAARIPAALDLLSWKWHWRNLNLLETVDSIYGNIAVGERWGQVNFYENGLHLFSSPDPAAAEEAVHYALLQHPSPHSLFLLGGGAGGGLAQALKYPDLSIDYGELDPRIIDLSIRHLPLEKEALNNPRVKIRYGDGRILLKDSRKHYDVIILNLPDPRTLQLNRFYTQEFFEIVRERLSPGGVFSFRVSSSENYLSPDQARYLTSLRNTLQGTFSEVAAFPGETCIFFASSQKGLLLRNHQDLVRRLKERRLQNQYVSEFFLPFRLHPSKMRDLEERLRGQDSQINRDLEPISYFFESTLWASQFGPWEKRVFHCIFRIPWSHILLFFLGFLTFLVALQAVRHSYLGGTLLGSVFVTGLTSISLEITALLSFQVCYGFVYHKLGLLLAAFMLGLSIGASWGRRGESSLGRLLLTQATLMALCLLFILGLMRFPAISAFPDQKEILFFLSLLLVGTVGGAQFCLANALFMRDRSRVAWGTIYAVDLWGSVPGALLFSTLLIPRWGIVRSLSLLVVLNVAMVFALSLNVLRGCRGMTQASRKTIP